MVEYNAVAGSASAAYAGNNPAEAAALQPRPLSFGDGNATFQTNKTQAAFVPKLYS
jgi:hypothetical protein